MKSCKPGQQPVPQVKLVEPVIQVEAVRNHLQRIIVFLLNNNILLKTQIQTLDKCKIGHTEYISIALEAGKF